LYLALPAGCASPAAGAGKGAGGSRRGTDAPDIALLAVERRLSLSSYAGAGCWLWRRFRSAIESPSPTLGSLRECPDDTDAKDVDQGDGGTEFVLGTEIMDPMALSALRESAEEDPP